MKVLSLFVAFLFLSALFPVTTAADEEEQKTIHSFDVSFDDYYDTSGEVYSDLVNFENEYPDIVEIYTLTDIIPAGQTWQGNEIFAVKISDNVANEPHYYDDPDEETSLIIGGQHGRDWMSVSTAMYYAYYLTHYYGMEPIDNDGDGLVNEDWIDGVDNDGDGEQGGRVDENGNALFDGIDNDGDGLIDEGIDEDIIEARVTYIVDNYEIWIIPLLNPDGYNYDREDPDRFWRKNMRDNDGNDRYGDQCDGVDLNRNFPLHWGYENSTVLVLDSLEEVFVTEANNPCSDVYHGPMDYFDDDGDGLVDEDDEDPLRLDNDGDGLLDEDRSGGFSEPETQVIEYLFWRLNIYEDFSQIKYLEDYQNGLIRDNWPDMFTQNDDGDYVRNYPDERLTTLNSITSAISYHSSGSRYIIPGSDFATPWNQESYDYLLNNLSSIGYQGCIQNCTAGSFIDWAHYNHGVFSLAVQLNSGSQGGIEGGFHANPVLIQPTSRMHLLTNLEILDDYSFMNNYTNTPGCTDPEAKNYDEAAQRDDGSCVYPIKGCMNSTAINYISWAEVEGECLFGPIAIAGQNATSTPGVSVQFSGAGTDEDGTVEKYEWDFDGDGIFEWSSFENGLNTYIYNNEGTYTATLRVTDNDGFTDTDSLTVTVKSLDNEDDEGIPSISLITSLILIGLLAIFRRK